MCPTAQSLGLAMSLDALCLAPLDVMTKGLTREAMKHLLQNYRSIGYFKFKISFLASVIVIGIGAVRGGWPEEVRTLPSEAEQTESRAFPTATGFS